MAECNRCSSDSIMTMPWAGRPGLDFRQGHGFFLSEAHSAFFPMGAGIKRPDREADHSSAPGAEVKSAWSLPAPPHTCSWRGA
jgi:hypothetical protein